MGDWINGDGEKEIGVTLDQAREKANNSVSGFVVEDTQGNNTTFKNYVTGEIIGVHYG